MEKRPSGIAGKIVEHRKQSVCVRDKLVFLDKPTRFLCQDILVMCSQCTGEPADMNHAQFPLRVNPNIGHRGRVECIIRLVGLPLLCGVKSVLKKDVEPLIKGNAIVLVRDGI